MNKKIFILNAVFIFALTMNLIFAQSISIKFISSETGYAVKPDFIHLTNNKSKIYIDKNEIKTNGEVIISLTPGTYDMYSFAEGFKPFSSTLGFNGNNFQKYNIYLEQITPPYETQSEYIISLHAPNKTLLLGFIVDEDSGLPLKNVKIYSKFSNNTSFTDSKGFFEIYQPSVSCEIGKYGDIIFEKSGYKSIVRQNLELYPNSDIIYR